jgi:hypothetical protein
MLRHLRLARRLVRRGNRLEIRRERRLRIDHHAAPARQPHHHVRPQRAALGGLVNLLLEVAILEHARDFHHAAQLHLAPAPAHAGRAERLDQVRRLALQRVLRHGQAGHLLLQARISLESRFLQLAHLYIEFPKRLLHRLHQLVDRQLPLFQIGARAFLEFLQRRAGEAQKRLVVAL